MNLTYNNFAIHNLGEFTLSQSRDYEEGQRAKVTLKVGVTIFQRDYAANYALVQQLKEALRTQNAVLQWTDTNVNKDYLNQTVTLQSSDIPDEWGTYQMQFNLVFFFYEQNIITSNMPLTFAPTGGASITLGNVTKFTESATPERFSPYHAQRSIVKGEVALSGLLLTDATLSLDDRRKALAKAKTDLTNALNSADGILQFGDAGSVFNRTVRPEKPSVEIDQLLYAVAWSFSASYVVFPDEANFATVEYQADERDPLTGEQWLTLTGKVTAQTEAIARAKLAALQPVALKQYGYDGVNVQQLRNDATPHLVSANADGDFFTELSFTLEFKRWRSDNQQATFNNVSLGNVEGWDIHYSARRFNELHSQRSHAGGQVAAKGTWTGTRDQLLTQQAAMYAAVNIKDGTLVYKDWSKTARIEDFVAKINQAYTGIEWSMTAVWSEFPNESGFATMDYTVAQSSNVEDGDERLTFGGMILAPDEASARSSLATLRTTVLASYGYNIAQQLTPQSTSRTVSADTDGVAFIELNFSEEYRRRRANLVSWAMQTSSKQDPGTGLQMTNYSGHVIASGSTVDVAYAAALAKAQALAREADILAQLGGNAYQKNSQITWDQRQTQASNAIEFVRLTFSYEYQSKLPAGMAYLEVNTDSTVESFGSDTINVSGSVVATDFATAQGIYQAQVRGAYNGSLIRNERTTQSKVMAQNSTGYTTQQLRIEFSFSAFSAKASGTVNYRYGITVGNDFLTLTRSTKVQGSVFANNEGAAAAAAAGLITSLTPSGSGLVRSEYAVDHEYTSASSTNAFLKYDFSAEWSGRITGLGGLLEMRVSESVKYSGVRWVIQPLPRNSYGSGGVSIPQDAGLTEGGRTVRGTVTATSAAAAQGWARQQLASLITGDGDADGTYCPLPPEIETEREFVPRIDGVATGSGQNVRLWRVNFSGGEILPNYPS